jgi:alpha-1,6-mannosyltransferase
MKLCDITMAYNAASGGIRTYIDEKRRFLRENTEHEHLLIIPGKRNRIRRSGRSTTVTLRGPLLPGQKNYRIFLSSAAIKEVLREEQPDIIELGSYYTEPWAAFNHRRRQREAGRACIIGGYFHTDVAEAYVASPLRSVAQSWAEDVGEGLASAVEKIADIAAAGAEKYMRHVFEGCDVRMAASPSQADRLRSYGVENVNVVPLGVDLKLFSPRRADAELRAKCGAGEDALVLIYAGRLCNEKRVLMLIEAFERLPAALNARLWLVGDGPLRDEAKAAAGGNSAIRVFPYQSSRERFAAMLASADLYVTAGPFETFGLSVIEAQASGLPVVGVDGGALRERVAPGLGLLAPVDDAAAFADSIVRAAPQRHAMGAAARAHVERHFSWSAAFANWLGCYGIEPARAEEEAPMPIPPPATQTPAIEAAY